MMQVGYNYYGKKVLKRLEDGEDLNLILMDVVKELQPFTDQALQMALDAMPGVLDKSIAVVSSILDQTVNEVSHDVYNYILNVFGIEGHAAGDVPPSSGTGGTVPSPPPPPSGGGYDWEGVPEGTITVDLQKLLDDLKEDQADYDKYIHDLAQAGFDFDRKYSSARLKSVGADIHIVSIKSQILMLVDFRSLLITQPDHHDVPNRIKAIYEISIELKEETDLWF